MSKGMNIISESTQYFISILFLISILIISVLQWKVGGIMAIRFLLFTSRADLNIAIHLSTLQYSFCDKWNKNIYLSYLP